LNVHKDLQLLYQAILQIAQDAGLVVFSVIQQIHQYV
jgi:hypothetical protein